jgi:uncharacterized protein YoaH (UPF0181 family)
MQQDLLLTQTELFQGLSHLVVVATELEQQVAWNQVEELKASTMESQAAWQQTKEELYEQRQQNHQLQTRISWI